MVEPRMVRLRKRDHKFVRPLIDREHPHSGLLHPSGVHERDELKQERGLLLEEVGRLGLDRSLELARIIAGDAVPSLGLAPVHFERETTRQTSEGTKGNKRERDEL